MRDFRPPHRRQWGLRASGILQGLDLYLVIEVSGQPVAYFCKGHYQSTPRNIKKKANIRRVFLVGIQSCDKYELEL